MARKAAKAVALQPANNGIARLLPVATTVVAMLLSLQPVQIPGYAALTPDLTLMVAYHWMVYRPDLLPSLALFVIGATQDVLAGAPPGVTSLLLLLARVIVLSHRDHFVDRSFRFVWTGFAMLTCGAMLLLWALNSMLAAELLELRDTVFRAVLTILLFPIASFLLGRTQRAVLDAG
jgi:rod shape-determining protein MreD